MDSESRRSDRDESQLSAMPDGSDSSDSETEQKHTEWLATSRSRRSTAGNRMKSMLANEEPDSDLELLFAEDENDQGFTDIGEDGSDVQMDSSSDDEDENNVADDMEGEKELERHAKERRAAQRKRKAQEAIPAKFRKKVRIDPAASDTSTPAPVARPKKKSERASWLPSPADLPTRASSRKTTRMSKEQLHQQMIEREERRLKQLEQMQKKAAKVAALKKPPMTQEDRLREAAIVEKRNSKSLNRWEVAERQREEERKAKLAALSQRTLKGPVITFWTGLGEARRVVIEEEKPKRKRVDKNAKDSDKLGDKLDTTDNRTGKSGSENASGGTANGEVAATQDEKPKITQPAVDGSIQSSSADSVVQEPPNPTQSSSQSELKKEPSLPVTSREDNEQTSVPVEQEVPLPLPSISATVVDAPAHASALTGTSELSAANNDTQSQQTLGSLPPIQPPTSGLVAPAAAPPLPKSSRQASPPGTPAGLVVPRLQEAKPSGVLAAPVLAPPPSMNGDYRPSPAPKSNILALPNTSLPKPSLALVTQSKPPCLQPIASTPPSSEPYIRNATLEPIQMEGPIPLSKSASPSLSEHPPPSASAASAPETTTRNAIIFQNFDENAIKDKSIQTQILFGRKMNKIAKPTPNPICVITNLPARYRDPKSGLPFYNTFAYREIQRLSKGEHHWSKILNAWIGTGKLAARGVPDRFSNPNAPSKTAEEREGERLAQAKLSQLQQQKQQPTSVSTGTVVQKTQPSQGHVPQRQQQVVHHQTSPLQAPSNQPQFQPPLQQLHKPIQAAAPSSSHPTTQTQLPTKLLAPAQISALQSHQPTPTPSPIPPQSQARPPILPVQQQKGTESPPLSTPSTTANAAANPVASAQ